MNRHLRSKRAPARSTRGTRSHSKHHQQAGSTMSTIRISTVSSGPLQTYSESSRGITTAAAIPSGSASRSVQRRLSSPSDRSSSVNTIEASSYISQRSMSTRNPPDMLHNLPLLKRKAADDEEFPSPDVDGRSDSETDMSEFSHDEISRLMEESYVLTPLDARMDHFEKLLGHCRRPFVNNVPTTLHIGLQTAVNELLPQFNTQFQAELLLTGAARTMNDRLLLRTIDAVKQKGFEVPIDLAANMLDIAVFRRDRNVFETGLRLVGPEDTWTAKVYEHKTEFHEIMAEFDLADETFATAVHKKVLPPPWKSQFKSHIKARHYVQAVPTDKPMWDEASPESDVIHMDNSTYLLQRVKFRYACYSLQGELTTDAHAPIRIPRNIVVQSCVRGRHAIDNPPDHKFWTKNKRILQDYIHRFGISTNHVSQGGNLFWIDAMMFDLLPTKGNQFPATPIKQRPWLSETRRAILAEQARLEAEEALTLEQEQTQAASAQ